MPQIPTLADAAQVPVAALRFYRRHVVWVVGISTIPGVQRFVSTLISPPPGVQGLMETATLVARLVLLGLIGFVAFRGSRPGAPLRFLRERWPSLLAQMLMLAAFTLVFSIGLESGVPAAVPLLHSRVYTAIVLLVKNPTVIAFVFIWIVLAVHQVVRSGPAESSTVTEDDHAT